MLRPKNACITLTQIFSGSAKVTEWNNERTVLVQRTQVSILCIPTLPEHLCSHDRLIDGASIYSTYLRFPPKGACVKQIYALIKKRSGLRIRYSGLTINIYFCCIGLNLAKIRIEGNLCSSSIA